MSEFQSAIQILRAKGYKVTLPRKQVLKVLVEAQKPVSPYDIQKILQQKGEHLNPVTIYRILDLFCLLNLAHRVLSTGGFVRCTLGEEEGCHRFMVCRQCGVLQEFVDKALCEEEDEVAQDLGFYAEQHFSEFSGLCSSCRG
jgi:Fe2+ or Zn2+ uptake regulation protein